MKRIDDTGMLFLLGLMVVFGLCPPIGVIIVIGIALFA